MSNHIIYVELINIIKIVHFNKSKMNSFLVHFTLVKMDKNTWRRCVHVRKMHNSSMMLRLHMDSMHDVVVCV